MINIFVTLNYPEKRHVTFTIFQFKGPTRAWWNMIRAKWERKQIARTWVNFIWKCNEKYLPPLVQEKSKDEFIKLCQGVLSVSEYEPNSLSYLNLPLN